MRKITNLSHQLTMFFLVNLVFIQKILEISLILLYTIPGSHCGYKLMYTSPLLSAMIILFKLFSYYMVANKYCGATIFFFSRISEYAIRIDKSKYFEL